MTEVNGVFDGIGFAQPEDEDDIFELLILLHSENGIFTVDEPKVREFIRQGTEKRGGIIGTIRGEERVEASVGLVLDQWWYSTDWCLSERWCFVHPDYRKTKHAQRLIEFAKWSADRLEVPLQMGIMSTSRTEAKERLYRRQLKHIGGYFMHGAGHVWEN